MWVWDFDVGAVNVVWVLLCVVSDTCGVIPGAEAGREGEDGVGVQGEDGGDIDGDRKNGSEPEGAGSVRELAREGAGVQRGVRCCTEGREGDRG